MSQSGRFDLYYTLEARLPSNLHSLRCSDELWRDCQATAMALGKSTNQWLVEWLPECVRYDRLLIREREERGAAELEHEAEVAARRT